MKSLLGCGLGLTCLILAPSGAFAEDHRSPLPPGPPAPVIVQPAELEQRLGLQEVVLEWSSVPGASHYHYVLSRDRRFLNIASESSTYHGTSVTLPALDYGTYFLRVKAVAPDGREGPFTERVSFIVVPNPRPRSLEKEHPPKAL